MQSSIGDKTITDILLNYGLLSESQVKTISHRNILSAQHKQGRRKGPPDEQGLVDLIVSCRFAIPGSEQLLTEERIMQCLAAHLHLPYHKINPLKLDGDLITRTLSRPFAIKHLVIPLSRKEKSLTVAVANPFDHETLEKIASSTGCKIIPVVSTRSDIRKVIQEFYGFKSSVEAANTELTAQNDLGNLEQFVRLKSATELEATDQHVIKAVEYLLQYAYDQRASDIHIEPKREHSLIRLRIDGVLHDVHKMPKAVHAAVVSRLKTLARMDIAEKRRPQDGRIKTDHKGKEVELRVSSLPMAFGEKIVIRVFDPDILLQDLEQMGFSPEEFATFKSFLSRPHGLILVTGPTGSGKTTTLYSAIKSLASREVNVVTIEDPIEMIYEGFNQTAVQPKIGVTFASALRTVLRQDPDIILLGEIRDPETAENAVQAALTGHLVFSSLHTNDAVSSITRLEELGIPPFLIAGTLIGVVAQRLVRKICSHCATEAPLPPDACAGLEISVSHDMPLNAARGEGCDHCRWTGYMGRTGIFEIVEMTDCLRQLITERKSVGELKKAVKETGVMSLRESAIRKMLQRVTTFEEVVKITGLH